MSCNCIKKKIIHLTIQCQRRSDDSKIMTIIDTLVAVKYLVCVWELPLNLLFVRTGGVLRKNSSSSQLCSPGNVAQ